MGICHAPRKIAVHECFGGSSNVIIEIFDDVGAELDAYLEMNTADTEYMTTEVDNDASIGDSVSDHE